MNFFVLAVPEESGYRFDPPTFASWVRERWPGTVVEIGDDEFGRLRYRLQAHPIDVLPDPGVEGGLRWQPVFGLVHDRTVPGGVRQLDSLLVGSAIYTLDPTSTRLWIDGIATLLDCAITAVWLRAKMPPHIPLFMSWLDDFTQVAVPIDIGVNELLLRYFSEQVIVRPEDIEV